MGNILVKVKRFLSNKNTVTILCVLAGILVLYIGYNWRVKSATEPIRIPYAKTALASRHKITRDDIGYMEVSGTVVSKMGNVIRNQNELIDYMLKNNVKLEQEIIGENENERKDINTY